jgi:hypothetical protein
MKELVLMKIKKKDKMVNKLHKSFRQHIEV